MLRQKKNSPELRPILGGWVDPGAGGGVVLWGEGALKGFFYNKKNSFERVGLGPGKSAPLG